MAELDKQRIAATALALIDKQGLAGFTMRAVAEAMGVTPMALYHHVKDKAGLAALVLDAATRERPLPPPTGDWREDLWAMALWTRRSTFAHPALARLRSDYQVWTPSMLQLTERWMTLWQQAGLSLEKAVRAGTLTSMVIVGLLEQETAHGHMDHPDESLLALLPNARHAFAATGDREAEFEMVVRAVIDGLHARLRG